MHCLPIFLSSIVRCLPLLVVVVVAVAASASSATSAEQLGNTVSDGRRERDMTGRSAVLSVSLFDVLVSPSLLSFHPSSFNHTLRFLRNAFDFENCISLLCIKRPTDPEGQPDV